MIRRVRIKNFKLFDERGIEIELGTITIFVGYNSAGKSTVLEALTLLNQSIGEKEVRYNRVINLSRFDEIVHKKELDRNIEIEINLKLKEDLRNKIARILGIDFTTIEKFGLDYSFEIRENFYKQKLKISDEILLENENEEVLDCPFGNFNSIKPKILSLDIENKEMKKEFELLIDILNFIKNELRSIFYISSKRGCLCSKGSNGYIDKYVGIDGERTLEILYQLYRKREKNALNKIENWLRNIGELTELQAGPEGDDYSADFIDKTRVPIKLEFTGHGNKQILPVVTQCFCTRNSLVCIEEPEISLHPQAQIKVLKMFSESCRDFGNRILFTTHSNILILAIPLVIEEIPSNEFIVYEFKRNEDGIGECNHLELDSDGYIKGGIPSYIEVEAQLFDKWVESLDEEE